MTDSAVTEPHPPPAKAQDRAARRKAIHRLRARWCRHPCPACPPPTGHRRVFIPFYGWLDVHDGHRARVDRVFHVPMLIMGLLVLPLLGIDWLQYHRNYEHLERSLIEHPVAIMATTIAMVVIWLAFLVEFVLKISIAPSRMQYAIKHWLDIVIIALPLLRPIQAAQVLRPARAARIFTLRGVATKVLRTGGAVVLGLELVQRVRSRFQKPAGPITLDYTQWPQDALIAEINRLQDRLSELEAQQRRAD